MVVALDEENISRMVVRIIAAGLSGSYMLATVVFHGFCLKLILYTPVFNQESLSGMTVLIGFLLPLFPQLELFLKRIWVTGALRLPGFLLFGLLGLAQGSQPRVIVCMFLGFAGTCVR